MPLLVNLRHLDAHEIRLEGQLSVEELQLETHDEVIHLHDPLDYSLEAQKMEAGLLVQGRLHLTLHCECVRCLKKFRFELELPEWKCHVPLQGEDAAQVINDCVDLTPWIRDDILLEFPQHPLCNSRCGGLPSEYLGKQKQMNRTDELETGLPAWNELNKLKL